MASLSRLLRKVRPLPSAVTLICWVCSFSFFALGLLLGAEPTLAPDFFVRSWQMDEGLSSNTVNSMVQDQNHFLWLATLEGVERFDGQNFRPYTSPLIGSVAARNIRALVKEDDSTLIMLPAVGGVVRLRGGEFSTHPMSAKVGAKALQSLFVDSGGAIWVSTGEGATFRWKDGAVLAFDFYDDKSGYTRKPNFAEDKTGSVWISSGSYIGRYHHDHLTRMDDKLAVAGSAVVGSSRTGGPWVVKGHQLLKVVNDTFTVISADLPWTPTGGKIDLLFEDSTGALWIGTRAHGLYYWGDHRFSPVTTSQSQITSLAEDEEGNIWAGTAGGGINRIRQKQFRLFNTSAGVPREVSAAVCGDETGDLWLANRSGGLVKIHQGAVYPVPTRFNGRPLNAYTLCADDRGGIWLSDDQLYRFNPETESIQVAAPALTGVHVLYKTRNGDLWIGGDEYLLGSFPHGDISDFQRRKPFPGKTIRCITEDADNNMWIGVENGQLYKLSGNDITTIGPDEKRPSSSIRALYADKEGTLWIGYGGAGLGILRAGKRTEITSAQGLLDNTIFEILEDDTGQLWFGSQRGIFHLPKRDLLDFTEGKLPSVSGITFGESEGLPRVSCYGTCQPMAWKDQNGGLWFATQQGVLAVNPPTSKASTPPPRVYIDEIMINDRALPSIPAKLVVPPDGKKIEFRFSAPSYVVPEKVQVRYKLEGIDPGWISTFHRSATYASLPPGNYRLRLAASNQDGVWNSTETTAEVEVRPILTHAVWFRFFFVLFVSSSLILLARYWTKRQLKVRLQQLERESLLEKERARIARDLHDDLGSSLTQVSLMLEEMNEVSSMPDIKAQASVISARVRDLAHDLHSVVWTVDPKNDSLTELIDFLSRFFLQSFRHTSIRPRLEVDDWIPHYPLSPEARHHIFLLIKEAVNNAIKHSKATEAKLSLRVGDHIFRITFSDNGVGFTPNALVDSKRHGLQNMESRVRELFGEFTLVTAPGRETVIHISLPLVGNSAIQPQPPPL